MSPDLPLRAKEMAKLLGISRRQLARWKQHKVPCHKIGDSTVYFPEEVLAWLRNRPHPRRQCAQKSIRR